MIEVTEVPDTNIVQLEITGRIDAREFDTALSQLEQAIARHGSIRVLEIIGPLEAPPIPWSRYWDDFKVGFQHLGDITHAAVVADQGWIQGWVRFLDPLLKAEIRTFASAERAAALAWLRSAA